MRSPILAVSARPILWAAVALSVWILLRGHNAPGGGFIGGLIAACGLIVMALAAGPRATRRILRVPPMVLAASGLLAAFASAIPGIVSGAPLLTHVWTRVALGPFALDLGTTMIFDIGVYLVVVGMATAVTLPFLREE